MIDIVFFGFAALTLFSALAVLLTQNVLYAAFCLLLTLLGVAGLFVLAGADFLAVAQIMIYVGGVLVLVIFGVMLTHSSEGTASGPSQESAQRSNAVLGLNRSWVVALLVAGTLFWALYSVLTRVSFALLNRPQSQTSAFPRTTVDTIGKQLMTEYVVPFEIAGVLLLAALVGAAYLSTPKKA